MPTLAVLIAILQNATGLNGVNRRIDDTNRRIEDTNRRIDDFRADINKGFDDAQNVWRAELRRVEEAIDARLQHLERE